MTSRRRIGISMLCGYFVPLLLFISMGLWSLKRLPMDVIFALVSFWLIFSRREDR